MPLASLTEHDVVALLAGLGLERYKETVLSVPLRGSDLVHCTEADLEAAAAKVRARETARLQAEEAKRVEEEAKKVEEVIGGGSRIDI